MGINYAYYYAVIDIETGMCIGVIDTSSVHELVDHIPLDEYNEEYILKYYYPIPQYVGDFNGSWYEDDTYTTPWSPN